MSTSKGKIYEARIVTELAKSAGIAEGDVLKVLNDLGLSEVIKEAGKQLDVGRLQSLRKADVKLSLRVGRLMVAV
jgi:hypothetical protein